MSVWLNRWLAWVCLLSPLLLLLEGCSSQEVPRALSPKQALQSFRLPDDLRIELFASEPYVVDPVEIAFDEAGRAYVAEMRDYPEDPQPGKPPRSRIRLLEDRDGDGQVDHSTVFADQLLQVSSVLPWKGGLIVTAAPDIIYLKDTDGDGKADVRKVLFSGFALANPERRVTNLRFAIDNWVYGVQNGSPVNIRSIERPNAPPVWLSGADFRFRLDRGLFEAESGTAQFGLAMDDWGHRFITDNTRHVRQVIIPWRYLTRNPFLSAGAPAQDISDHGQPSARIFPLTSPQHWRQVRSQMRQQRYRELGLDRVRPLNPSTEVESGFFTAAAGGTIYSGEQLPDKYRGNLFTGDVSANLVHRDILHGEGTHFVASRSEEEKDREFLTSTDPWFRPCNFATGPDGYLYVVDIYREFVETPESIPEELKKSMNFYSGDQLGRIYRISPKNAPTSRKASFDLGKVPSTELVRVLSHPNNWWRLTAQRLLLERQDRSVIPLLKKRVVDGTSPQERLHALYVLEGMSAIDLAVLRVALKDTHPNIREHAVRLAESFPEQIDDLASMVKDPSLQVRFQLALSLGQFARPQAVKALAHLSSLHGEDQWFRMAILSSPQGASVRLLEFMLNDRRFFLRPTDEKMEFLRDLAAVVGARNTADEVSRLLYLTASKRLLNSDSWRRAALSGLASGLDLAVVKQLRIPSAESLFTRLFNSPSEEVQDAAHLVARHFELRGLISSVTKEALNASLSLHRREMAIVSLGCGSFEEVHPVLEKLLAAPLDPSLFRAALKTLSSFDDSGVSDLVLKPWKRLSPDSRNQVLDVLLGHRLRALELIRAVETGRVEKAAFDFTRREKLLRNPDAEISSRANQLFREETSDRAAVVRDYLGALKQRGDAARGKVLFEKNCSTCHMPQKGHRVGPDLSGVSSNTKEQLLQSILNPSQDIAAEYTNYIVITRDGRIHDGIKVAETPGSLTLRNPDEGDESILRAHITEIRASSVSLMPEGLEKNLSKSDVANLIAFLQGND